MAVPSGSEGIHFFIGDSLDQVEAVQQQVQVMAPTDELGAPRFQGYMPGNTEQSSPLVIHSERAAGSNDQLGSSFGLADTVAVRSGNQELTSPEVLGLTPIGPLPRLHRRCR